MTHSLIVVDDFAPNPEEIRDKALKAGFGPIDHLGATYEHIGHQYNPGLVPLIEEAVGFRIIPKMEFFRCDLESDALKSWVHADSICAQYASVYYLNPPDMCKGGTAFWIHRGWKWDRLPTKEDLIAYGMDLAVYEKEMMAAWNSREPWDMVGFVGMKFNRFITYPTYRFHSRYPFEAFGTQPEDGRLIWVCFYNRA